MNSKESKKLDNFEIKLSKARLERKDSEIWQLKKKSETTAGLNLAFRISIELVSALGIGFGIGWLLDQLFGSQPWLMLIFVLFGGAAGILNVYRQAENQNNLLNSKKS
ncbi:MAG: ATP synthase protein I [Alphaproteobacteria bacterium MarineAlpha3_Bin5]|nr:hypothetical protein [Magnetovibrio sp.]PPR78439.1 MAG: ATP synthase protein I [Alphaproteobacteria bacterium MarineAlpha3_Bin5]